MVALPTLVDLKTYLNITETADDGELTDMLDAAVNVVENIVGPLSGTPVTETHYGVAGPFLVLRRVPAASLTAVSVRLYTGMDPVAQDVTAYSVDTDTGVVRLVNGYPLRGDVTVTYSAGYDTVPAAVSLATLIVAAQLWETQRGAMPLPANATDDQTSFGVGFAPAIPDRAKTLLEPFARGPMVA
jgi:hypothetical protein